MKYLDLTFADAATNLACDEALLSHCEACNAGEVLRLWEPTEYFVVLGYANKVMVEVNVEGCEREKIPIFRRFSGGGAVLQGPGCLNYSLVVKNERVRSFRNIAKSFHTVLNPHQNLFARLMTESVQIEGISDLAIGGKKFSGNSQHRKLRYTLFHGTVLLNLDLSLIEATLRMPSKQPWYRKGRSHTQFLRNLTINAECARRGLKNEWGAVEELYLPADKIEQAVQDRYSQRQWNFRF
jgi:lipoate-protein ligase A